jgi:hypothetical protein
MADQKVTDLADLPGDALAAGDKIYVARGGVDYKLDGANVGGGGGGGDPWANYGTPAWRYDFNSSADLTDWTYAVGSSADLSFKSQGGMFSTANVVPVRSVANAPFVYDVRVLFSRPTTGAGAEVGLWVQGNLVSGRQAAFALSTATNANGTPAFRIVRRLNNTNQGNLFSVDIGNGGWPGIVDGVTFRVYYDGTNYNWFTLYHNLLSVDQFSSTQVEAKSAWLGDPVNVGVWFGGALNSNSVALFAQFQDTDLDKYAGM